MDYEVPVCPHCGSKMVLRQTNKFFDKYGTVRYFYGCPKYPDCNSTVGAHADGRPMGFPAPDQETKEARNRAHDVFDPIWKFGGFDRSAMYRRIAGIMGIPVEKCHIGMFTKEDCEKFIESCYKWIEQKRNGKKQGKTIKKRSGKR